MSQVIFRGLQETASVRGIMRMALENRIVMAVYRYKLIDGTGGTYRSSAPTIYQATRELKTKYGNRLDKTSIERVMAS